MDTIVGHVDHDGVVQITINADKVGYIILPNKTVLTTVAGVINSTNTGIAGIVTFYVPKNVTTINISGTDIVGELAYNGVAEFTASECVYMTKLTANLTEVVTCTLNPLLVDVFAQSVYEFNCDTSALSAGSIGDILRYAQINPAGGKLSVSFDFSGGANALQSEVNSYLLAAYGLSYADLYNLLVTVNGGTIVIDTV